MSNMEMLDKVQDYVKCNRCDGNSSYAEGVRAANGHVLRYIETLRTEDFSVHSPSRRTGESIVSDKPCKAHYLYCCTVCTAGASPAAQDGGQVQGEEALFNAWWGEDRDEPTVNMVKYHAWEAWQAARSAQQTPVQRDIPRPVLTETKIWELAKQAGLAQNFGAAKRFANLLERAVREGG